MNLGKLSTYVLASVVAILLSACEQDAETLAKIDGQPVTKAEFQAYLKLKRLPASEERRAKLLEQYVDRKALAMAIDKAIEESDEIDRALLEAELAEFRKEMLISRYFEQYLDDKVTEQAVVNYYNGHPEEFQQKQAHVAHVLFRTRQNMSEEERKAVLTTAQEAWSKIRAGADFAEVAADYSEDRISGKKGGDLGWLKEGAISPEFSQTVFNMEPGDVSEPFETPFGFHVVKLIEGPVVAKRPLDAVKGDIRYRLRNEARDAELERLVDMTEIEIE